MASIINAIAGDPGANSYVDLATANTYFNSARMYTAEWQAAAGTTTNSYPTQETALIWATAILDQVMEWNGYKATRDQKLRWPRSACYDPDGFYVDKTTIPQRVQEITCQLAWELIKQNRLVEPSSIGIGFSGRVRIGPIEATLDPKGNFLPIVPLYLREQLSWWGNIIGLGETGSKVVKVLRV